MQAVQIRGTGTIVAIALFDRDQSTLDQVLNGTLHGAWRDTHLVGNGGNARPADTLFIRGIT